MELDTVGAPFQSQPELLDTTVALIEAGYENHLLLSHDAGWYSLGSEGGLPKHGYRGYTALATDFIPDLLKRGVAKAQVRQITVTNPAHAFAF